MRYRICKAFTVESGHMLSKHPSVCRHPHGHTRRIEVVLSSETLDEGDMVCDFKAVKLAVGEFIEKFDHALAINSADPLRADLERVSQRLIVFEDEDPTTEVMARRIYEFLEAEVRRGGTYTDARGGTYRFPPGLEVERVRVGETPSSWAEYGRA